MICLLTKLMMMTMVAACVWRVVDAFDDGGACDGSALVVRGARDGLFGYCGAVFGCECV